MALGPVPPPIAKHESTNIKPSMKSRFYIVLNYFTPTVKCGTLP